MSSLALRTIRSLSRASPTRHTAISTLTNTSTTTTTVRTFAATSVVSSGHSRWSKIKHDKGKLDSRRGASFSKFSQEISFATRDGGVESSNLRLNAAMAVAKKAGMPKDRINVAIQRGLGKTVSGAALEQVIIEAVAPGSVGLMLDCQTDNKLRALQDIKSIVKKYGGQSTSVKYLFSRKGIIRILAGSGGHDLDQVMECALELDGTEDVDEVPLEECEEGKAEIMVSTDPIKTGPVVAGLKERLLGLEVISYGIEYVPNEDTMVSIEDIPKKLSVQLTELMEKLEEYPEIAEIYTNAK